VEELLVHAGVQMTEEQQALRQVGLQNYSRLPELDVITNSFSNGLAAGLSTPGFFLSFFLSTYT
jgi:hypothetical protein